MNRSKSAPMKKQTTATRKAPAAYRAPAARRVPATQKVPAAKKPVVDKTPTANKTAGHYSATSAVVTLAIVFSSMASASFKFTEVSEQQLSEIRGKFIARDKVRYFKLEMTTQWTDHTSFDHGAGLSLTPR